ncbi:ketopantoate reductase family protein [Candidatus Margulisiibacteriota bacterium]
MKKLKVLVLGSGAIGSLYGGKLQKAGAEVALICRSDFATVKNKGIFIKSPGGDWRFNPDEVISAAKEYSGNPDYILITTKVLPKINVTELIRLAVRPGTSLILLQNGIDIEKGLQKKFPGNEIISGLAFVCATRIKPGLVNHQEYGKLVFGLYPKGNSPKVQTLCRLFEEAGVPCKEDKNIIWSRWKKLIWNVPFNSISVLAGGLTTAQMLKNEQTKDLVNKIMQEVYLLAEKTGNKLKPDVIQSNIDATLRMPPYKTSMLVDFENNREMEVEAIVGNVVRIAKELNFPVPHIETLYALLNAINSS